MCVCVRARARVCSCVRACVCVCACACARAHARGCACVCVRTVRDTTDAEVTSFPGGNSEPDTEGLAAACQLNGLQLCVSRLTKGI